MIVRKFLQDASLVVDGILVGEVVGKVVLSDLVLELLVAFGLK